MKNLITIINLAILFAITSIFDQSEKIETNKRVEYDHVEVAASNIVQASDNTGTMKSNFAIWSSKWNKDDKTTDEVIADFLIEMTQARIMELEQGKTAAQRATTRPLKDYGSLMVSDQSEMLAGLKALATRKQIDIPTELESERLEALADLKKVHGESFDKKFIKRMITDHKRDIKKLQRATRSSDADLQVFATRYLPVVQSHLDQIRALR
jgi:putative membrane protein